MLRSGTSRTLCDAVMPFELRLIAHDLSARDGDEQARLAARARVEADEFESPECEALAVQLGDDADYLAQLYSPRTMPTRPLAQRRGWSHATTGRWRIAAVVIWLAGTAVAWGVWDVASRARSMRVAFATSSIANLPRTIGAGTVIPATNFQQDGVAWRGPYSFAAAALRDSNSKHVTTEADFSGLEPGELLQDLSVSEQEAVLDLLESEPIELARISL